MEHEGKNKKLLKSIVMKQNMNEVVDKKNSR